LFAFKEGDQILNQVQPQEYIEFSEDLNLSLTQKSGKKCRFAKASNDHPQGVLFENQSLLTEEGGGIDDEKGYDYSDRTCL
jgi:hypothetical protein